MKKLLLSLAVISLTLCGLSQVPAQMSYQCVVRDASQHLVPNQIVSIRVSILLGSPSGTVIYRETYTPKPQTDANGLVSVEIGGGTPSIGTFSTIDWSSGPYYLKTETDPNGNASYTIVGTSQLLSVPYALYSKIAGNGFSGNYNDLTNRPTLFNGTWASLTSKPSFATVATTGNYNDLINKPTLFNGTWSSLTGKPTTIAGYGITDAFNGTWSSLTGKPTLATVATSGSYNDLTNKPIINGSETKVTAGTNVTVTGTGTTASPYVINSENGGGVHSIGESYGGGIVFYVYDNGQHGLIAAAADLTTGIQWYNGTYKYTGITSDGVGAGEMNTSMIVAIQISDNVGGNFATKACANFNTTVGGVNYGDWYLPSRFELNLLYKQKNVVGGFNDYLYWSSSEYTISYAWAQYFGDGNFYQEYKNNTNYIRPIRSF